MSIFGGALSGVELDAPSTVAAVARTAQFGELLDFCRWAYLVWAAAIGCVSVFLSGLEGDASTLVEFGAFRKVGDATTPRV